MTIQHRDTREYRPRSRHRRSEEWERARRDMFATYGRVCWICGHDGAGEADHLDALSRDPDQPIDPARLRPAHGSNYPCHHPACLRAGKPRSCNQERGNRPLPTVVPRTRMAW